MDIDKALWYAREYMRIMPDCIYREAIYEIVKSYGEVGVEESVKIQRLKERRNRMQKR